MPQQTWSDVRSEHPASEHTYRFTTCFLSHDSSTGEPSWGHTHMFEFKQNFPVQLHALPVGVFDGHNVPLEGHTSLTLLTITSPHKDNGCRYIRKGILKNNGEEEKLTL